MKLLILSALVAVATAGPVPDMQIKSIVLPEPVLPNFETANEYVPHLEPISFGMIMIPQEVLDAIAAEQQVYAVHFIDNSETADVPVEPVNAEDLTVKFVDSPLDEEASAHDVEVQPIEIAELHAVEPISAGELETVRVAMPEAVNEVEPVKVVDTPIGLAQEMSEPIKVVDAPIELVQEMPEAVVETVKVVDAPLPDIRAQYPHLRYPDPTWR